MHAKRSDRTRAVLRAEWSQSHSQRAGGDFDIRGGGQRRLDQSSSLIASAPLVWSDGTEEFALRLIG